MHFCVYVFQRHYKWVWLHLWQYTVCVDRDKRERKSKRQKDKQEVFSDGLWGERGGHWKDPLGGASITLRCLIGVQPLILCPRQNDLYITLVGAGGNVRQTHTHTHTQTHTHTHTHTHTQTGLGSSGLRQEIPLQPFCWLRPLSENRVRKNVMYMVSELFGRSVISGRWGR